MPAAIAKSERGTAGTLFARGGESDFSKVIRDGFLPPDKTDLLRNLECQGKMEVWRKETFGEPCGDFMLSTDKHKMFAAASV